MSISSTGNPRISVVIATHNHACFLPRCLDSVRRQTYADYEVILVNNGSTDNTEEVVRGLAWDKLRYVYQNDTGSVAGPRNSGIRMAKGEYVAFLDSDDFWYPEKLETVMRAVNNDPAIDIIAHDVYFSREGKGRALFVSGTVKKDMFASLLFKNRIVGSATVVKKSVIIEIGGFDEDKGFMHVEDYETWLRIASLGKKFHLIGQPLGENVFHGSNLSLDFQTQLNNEIRVLNKHMRGLNNKNCFLKFVIFSTHLSRVYFKMGTQFIFRKKPARALDFLVRSLLINPVCFFSNFAMLFYKFFRPNEI